VPPVDWHIRNKLGDIRHRYLISPKIPLLYAHF
jgi:hypothetical protein